MPLTVVAPVIVVVAAAAVVIVVVVVVVAALLIPELVGEIEPEFHVVEGVLESQAGEMLTELERLGPPSFLRLRHCECGC